MLTSDPDLQLILDLTGVFIFGLSGGLVAVAKRLDALGVIVLAWCAALGGGVLRDVLLGDVPPVGIRDWRLLTAACVAGVLIFFFHPGIARIARLVRVLDAAGLGLFAVGGAMKALSMGAAPITCVLIGAMTAVGGGVVRDVLVGRVPEVLRRELYAVPALLGGTIVVVADRLHQLTPLVAWGAVVAVFAVRIAAVMLDLNAPRPLRTGDPQ